MTKCFENRNGGARDDVRYTYECIAYIKKKKMKRKRSCNLHLNRHL